MATGLLDLLSGKSDNRCAYIYRGDEVPCLVGNRKPGERCPFDKKEGSLYCGHHDPHRGDQKKLDDRIAVRERIQDQVFDKSFDFTSMMNEMRGTDPLPGEEFGLEKYLFVLWVVASEESRKPKTIEEVAVLLERSVSQLRTWLRSPVLKQVTDIERTRLYMMNSLYIDALLAEKARAGERWAIQLFLAQSPGGKMGEIAEAKVGKRGKQVGVKGVPQKINIDGPTRDIVQKLSKTARIPGVRYEVKRKTSYLRDEGQDDSDIDTP